MVAVVIVVSIVVSIAAVSLRSSSDSERFEQAAREFTAFVGRARFQALELGRDRVIVYHPGERKFTASDPHATDERDEDSMNILELPERLRNYHEADNYQEPQNFTNLKWVLPEDYELETDGNAIYSDRGQGVEMFRFYADGGGSGTHKFILQHREMKKVFNISPLTGLLTEVEEKMR